MEHTKESIRKLLMNGDLKAAIHATQEYADFCGLTHASNQLVLLLSKANKHEEAWESKNLTNNDYFQKHGQIGYELINWINYLPDNPVTKSGKRARLTNESSFKKWIFYALLGMKVIVFAYLYYHWETGGFTVAEFQGTATLLFPAFAAYITVIVNDYLKQTESPVKAPKYIVSPLVTFSYWLFPIYFLTLIVLIRAKAKTDINFIQMNFWLATAESVLGGYIGRLVNKLFKKE